MTWFDPAPFGWSRSTRRCRREAASETGIINRALYLLFSLPPLHSPAPAGAWDFAACAGWRSGAGGRRRISGGSDGSRHARIGGRKGIRCPGLRSLRWERLRSNAPALPRFLRSIEWTTVAAAGGASSMLAFRQDWIPRASRRRLLRRSPIRRNQSLGKLHPSRP